MRAMDIFSSAWNTAVKLTWNVPRDTYTYIVENLLARNFQSLRNQIYSRYSRFFQSLLNSSSREVSFLANIVAQDCQYVTAKNVKLVERAAGCSPWDYSTMRIKAGLKKPPAPENDEWRLPLLLKMLDHRRHEESLLHKTENLSKMTSTIPSSHCMVTIYIYPVLADNLKISSFHHYNYNFLIFVNFKFE